MLPEKHPLRDFRNFLFLIWEFAIPSPDGEPCRPTPLQYDIASALTHGPKRMIIEAFRGVGKSWITAAFVVWLLLMNPDRKIMVVSASKSRADDFSAFCKMLIHGLPVLHHLKADSRKNQRDSLISFDVGPAKPDQSPSVKSVGIMGQLTGSRADVIVADDIEVPSNSYTPMMRERLAELVKEFDAVLKPLPTSRVIYLGTPQTEESLYNKLVKRGYEAIIWPARVLAKKAMEAYEGKLAPYIVKQIDAEEWKEGSTTDPERFNDIDLLEREGSYGRSGFALQFMLDTSLSDAERYPLKLGDLMVMDLSPDKCPPSVGYTRSKEYLDLEAPCCGFTGDRIRKPMLTCKPEEWTDYQGGVLAIDPSGRGGDDTGYAIVKQLNGKLFVTAAGGLPGGYDKETLMALALLAKTHKVGMILIESNFGDGMFEALFKPILGKVYPCTVEETRSSKQKEHRIIDTLEPLMNQHRLVVDRELLITQSTADNDRDLPRKLFYQMTRITRDRGCLQKSPDALDALAMACAYWVSTLEVNEDDAVRRHQEELLMAELQTFTDGILGNSPADSNWTDSIL